MAATRVLRVPLGAASYNAENIPPPSLSVAGGKKKTQLPIEDDFDKMAPFTLTVRSAPLLLLLLTIATNRTSQWGLEVPVNQLIQYLSHC